MQGRRCADCRARGRGAAAAVRLGWQRVVDTSAHSTPHTRAGNTALSSSRTLPPPLFEWLAGRPMSSREAVVASVRCPRLGYEGGRVLQSE